MDTLDLHGIRHKDAPRLIENFVLPKDTPVRIITGLSPIMQNLVKETLAPYGLKAKPENDWNLGSLIITESEVQNA